MKIVVLALAALAVVGLVLVRAVRPAQPAFIADAPPRPHPSLGHRMPAAAMQTPSAVVVYVAGAVVRPGVYALAHGKRVDDAVRSAGGAAPGADLIALNLAAPLVDGTEIVVRKPGEPPVAGMAHRRGISQSDVSSTTAATHAKRATGHTVKRKAPPGAPIDINVAEAAELATLPGIGLGLAERIVAFREANGPFADPSDLLDVSGITQRRLATIAPYITVAP